MYDLVPLVTANGFEHYGYVNTAALVPLQAVRDMCSADRCGRYGKSWSCPPACPPVEEAAVLLSGFNKGILVQSTAPLRDSFDYGTMEQLGALHKKRFLNLVRQVRLQCPGCLPLSAGSCTVCRRCTYPDKPCRFPDKRLNSMEAMGLFVSDVCAKSGLGYNYGENTLTYTSCILYKEDYQ